MAYLVQAAGALGSVPYTIDSLVELLSGINPPASIAFQMLPDRPGRTTELSMGDAAPIQFTPEEQVVRAVRLISCASVSYTNTATGASYVYHANTGNISQGSFNAAITAIGAGPPPYDSVVVAVAHPRPASAEYQASVQNLVNWGVPTTNIVEIANLLVPQFGLNNLLQLGY